jgi:hypothetical protein
VNLRKRIERLEAADAAMASNDRTGWCSLWPIAVHPGEPTPDELAAYEDLFRDGRDIPLEVDEELKTLATGIGLGDTPIDGGRTFADPSDLPGGRHEPA